MKINGHTKPYAVLGHPVEHSLSPRMHNASFESLGLDAVYLAFDVAPEHLVAALHAMEHMGFGGVNVTVPLKEVAFEGIEDLAPSALRVGAVNTVEFPAAGGMRGHNTDGDGFVLAVREAFDSPVRGLSVFILGTGGAGRAVALTCAAEGAARVCVSDVDTARAGKVREEVAQHVVEGGQAELCPADEPAWTSASLEADLVVQATPVGMKPGDASLLPQDAFREGQMAFDLVYMYPKTRWMAAAEAAGAKAANGLGMLLHQGAHAFSVWTGREADVSAMRRALEDAVYGRGENRR